MGHNNIMTGECEYSKLPGHSVKKSQYYIPLSGLFLSPFSTFAIACADCQEKKEWNGLVRALMDEKAEMSLASLSITPERNQMIDFSVPFLETGITIIVAVRDGVISPTAFLGMSLPVADSGHFSSLLVSCLISTHLRSVFWFTIWNSVSTTVPSSLNFIGGD